MNNLEIKFQELIKQVITKRLKTLGYKKRNLLYNKEVIFFTLCIRIQKSRIFSDEKNIVFTINYGCFDEYIFRLSRNKKPSVFINDNDCFLDGRTGHLIYGHDYWYKLSSSKSNLNKLTKQLSNDFDNMLLPLMKKLEDINYIKDFLTLSHLERFQILSGYVEEIAVFELKYNDFEKGKSILIELYKKALIPKSVKGTTVYPDGSEIVKWSEPKVNQYMIDKLERFANEFNVNLNE